MSTALMRPLVPTWVAAQIATAPVPVPRSRIVSPGRRSASLKTCSITGPKRVSFPSHIHQSSGPTREAAKQILRRDCRAWRTPVTDDKRHPDDWGCPCRIGSTPSMRAGYPISSVLPTNDARTDAHLLLQLKNDRTLDDGRWAYAEVGRVFADPFLGDATAFIGACLVLTDCHRHSAVNRADERIAHEAFHRTNQALDLGLASVQKVDQLFRAGTRERPDDRVHDILPGFFGSGKSTPFPFNRQRGAVSARRPRDNARRT